MKSWFKMQAQNCNAEIQIYDEIGIWGIGFKVFKAMLDDLGDVKNITLRVNSPGGDVLDGFAIYNVLKETKANIEAVIEGYAASIASVIVMAANKITMPGNSFLMIHNPWMYTIGDAESLRKDAKLLDQMKNNAIAAYRNHAKALSDQDISTLMDDTTWLTADDAKTYGFVDVVTDPIEIKNSLNQGKLKLPENVIKALAPSALKIQEKEIKNLIPAIGGKGDGMNKCPKCGKDVVAETQFCSHCGASMKIDTNAIFMAHEKEVKEAQENARKDEKHRAKEITARCRHFNLSLEFETALIDGSESLDSCIIKILDEIQKTAADPLKPGVGANITTDEADKFRAMAKNAICVVSGLENDPKIVAELQGVEIPTGAHSLIRTCLLREGKVSPHKISNMSNTDLASQAVRLCKMEANISSSDLSNILADVANKSVQVGMQEEPTTYQTWCAQGETKDFKNINMVSMSNFADMKEIKQGEDFTKGRVSDKKETTALKTYGRATTLTRQAIINDDLSALTDIPRLMTRAQFRAINMAVYDSLVSGSLTGPLMNEDGYRLFDATYHVNLIDPSNVPSISTLGTARSALRAILAMKSEKDAKDIPTGSTPRYIISGPENEAGIDSIIYVPPVVMISNTQVYNPFTQQGGRTPLVPVIDSYLGSLLTTASKANAWYLAADQNLLPTYKVFFLNGVRVPTFRMEPSAVAEALGITYDTFFDWCVGLMDWRGLVYNDGDAT